jgi:hypothetical protein
VSIPSRDAEGVGEGVLLGFASRRICEECDETFAAIVPVPALEDSVQVADIPHRIDFDIEEEFQRKRASRSALASSATVRK